MTRHVKQRRKAKREKVSCHYKVSNQPSPSPRKKTEEVETQQDRQRQEETVATWPALVQVLGSLVCAIPQWTANCQRAANHQGAANCNDESCSGELANGWRLTTDEAADL